MGHRPLQGVLQRIRRLLRPPIGTGVSDAELLGRFVAWRDEAAFELLVRRYEKVVFAVCRRVLHDVHDAEDAFQATFLVLVRKAGSIARRESLASWLTRVAFRIALRASREASPVAVQSLATVSGLELIPSSDSGLRTPDPALLEELDRLPAKFRAAVVLCYLDGKTHEEAARQLGWPKGTVASRLARARARLRTRLVRRGVTLSAAGLTAAMQQESAAGPVLIESTIRSALVLACHAGAGLVSPTVLALTEGALRAMFLKQLKVAAVWLMVIGLVGGGAGVLAYRVHAGAGEPGLLQAGGQDADGREVRKDADSKKEIKQLRDQIEAQNAVITRLTNERIQAQVAAQTLSDRVQQLQKQLADLQAKKVVDVGTPIKRDELRYDGKTFAEWQGKLRTELKPQMRAEALKAMGAFGTHGYAKEAATIVMDVVKGYREGDKEGDVVLIAAYDALIKIGVPATPAITEALKGENVNARLFALSMLSHLKTEAKTLLPILIEALKDEHVELRRQAVLVILQTGLKNEGLLSGLVAALRDEDDQIREHAALVLGQYGTVSKEAIQALTVALKDHNRNVRSNAVKSLSQVGDPKQTVPVFIEALKHPEASFRQVVIEALAAAGPGNEEAVAALSLVASTDENSSIRSNAAAYIQRIRQKTKTGAPMK